MKTIEPSSIRTRHRTLACLIFLFFGLTVVSNGQESPVPASDENQQTGKTEKDFTIRIGIEEVRLDTVVLDQKGRQITDLTADDFEIYQDHFRQKVTSCVYINDYQPRLQKTVVASKDSRQCVLQCPVPAVTRENVRRTIVFVVDNLAMDFTQVHRARRALRKFVETQMQEGDLVAIVPTAGGNATFQTFSSDKRQLLSMIDNVRWFIDVRTTQMTSQMMAMAYSIRTLQDMPGTQGIDHRLPCDDDPSPLTLPNWRLAQQCESRCRYTEATFNPLADAALRAGVVIHTLDIQRIRRSIYGIDAEQGFDYSLLSPERRCWIPEQFRKSKQGCRCARLSDPDSSIEENRRALYPGLQLVCGWNRPGAGRIERVLHADL